MKHALILATAAMLLSACALTPEEQAKRAVEQKRYEQDLQVSLAAQCDKDTAALIRQQFDQPEFASEREKQDFRLRYVEKVNDPMFQSCYKMAWQNYSAQRRLRQMENYYDDWGWRRFPFHHPFWW
ncbi:hypothetical protein [Kingella negevensis]|uniref:Lipoprotein n=1 Tax=Kingella negevensis TaxID=1522312 RepID=A0A238T910_9NEIS|nr:hypothetical protein [Kingella negevensis]MDK4681122.1 hypothetical protein [Kingella negevensis]MDK4683324.1 hypothetical protein [Kingella negevensis]MDK4684329.1 hypothetical protein [Kingella negevensis]MDK4688177.1 hypothetical protein [Kingella negevensis]MDK4691545.1 hypothetical protein [Kingella negevensis]